MLELFECSKCNFSLNSQDVFCNNCGYPERGNQEQKEIYEDEIKVKKFNATQADKELDNVRILLKIIIALTLLVGMFYLFSEDTFEDGIACLVATLIYIGCLIWVNKQPLSGVLAAFLFWLTLQLSVVFTNPVYLFKGIIWKILFISIFIKGINSARKYQKISNQLKNRNAN